MIEVAAITHANSRPFAIPFQQRLDVVLLRDRITVVQWAVDVPV